MKTTVSTISQNISVSRKNKKRASEDTLRRITAYPVINNSYAESTRHFNTSFTIINPK